MITKKIKKQILAIRDAGVTNMLDTRAVQYYANEFNFYELVVYLEDNRLEYWKFIMTGKAPMENDDGAAQANEMEVSHDKVQNS